MMASQTIKEKIVELQNSKKRPKNSRPKIQRVAEHIRNRKNFEQHYYSPRLVSIGPIHHGNTNLKLGENYKLMWAAKYIENTEQSPDDLYHKIAGKIDELKGRFDDNVLTLTGKFLEGFGSLEEKLSWMLVVDGCSLLNILDYYGWKNIEEVELVVMMDVLLLENQLPYEVLKLLWKDDESELIQSMRDFLYATLWGIIPIADESQSEKNVIPNWKDEGHHSVSIPNESPTHLLDLQRKIILTTSKLKPKSNEANNTKWCQKLLLTIKNWGQKLLLKVNWSQKNSKEFSKLITYRNIQDLKAVGIRLKSSESLQLTDVDFIGGWFTAKLILPRIIVDYSLAPNFLNLIAYEMCPDFENDYGIYLDHKRWVTLPMLSWHQSISFI